jgi:hypothetical protein
MPNAVHALLLAHDPLLRCFDLSSATRLRFMKSRGSSDDASSTRIVRSSSPRSLRLPAFARM